jgi:hypothetical protein
MPHVTDVVDKILIAEHIRLDKQKCYIRSIYTKHVSNTARDLLSVTKLRQTCRVTADILTQTNDQIFLRQM